MFTVGFNYLELLASITDANDYLREICDGRGEVRIQDSYAWLCEPATGRLTFTASEDAPYEAIEAARRICHKASYCPWIEADIDPYSTEPERIRRIYNLRGLAGSPVPEETEEHYWECLKEERHVHGN